MVLQDATRLCQWLGLRFNFAHGASLRREVNMTKVKALSPAKKAARVVRSTMSRDRKLATVKSATKRVNTSARVDFVRIIRG